MPKAAFTLRQILQLTKTLTTNLFTLNSDFKIILEKKNRWYTSIERENFTHTEGIFSYRYVTINEA